MADEVTAHAVEEPAGAPGVPAARTEKCVAVP